MNWARVDIITIIHNFVKFIKNVAPIGVKKQLSIRIANTCVHKTHFIFAIQKVYCWWRLVKINTCASIMAQNPIVVILLAKEERWKKDNQVQR